MNKINSFEELSIITEVFRKYGSTIHQEDSVYINGNKLKNMNEDGLTDLLKDLKNK